VACAVLVAAAVVACAGVPKASEVRKRGWVKDYGIKADNEERRVIRLAEPKIVLKQRWQNPSEIELGSRCFFCPTVYLDERGVGLNLRGGDVAASVYYVLFAAS